MRVRSHRIDKIDRIDKITRGVGGIILGVGSHRIDKIDRIDKITRGEGADFGGDDGPPRIDKIDTIDKITGGVSRFCGSQVIEACTAHDPPWSPPCLNRGILAVIMGIETIDHSSTYISHTVHTYYRVMFG